ncbi:HlyD family secretion protein [Photobacterium sanguinicancri]|uniref:Secretion protein n=1 Tax=Photobacterium sanguinicancri TaxID=875932 RepID=A0ABX4FWU3_9GAMM|nr:HlyD family secretion protein [Photobacterium sanguinicancri]OZS43377.1 secretion protein [Photobacterium sanguinicancri]
MSEDNKIDKKAEEPRKVNKVKITTNALLALAVVSISTAIISDRIIPTTDNARVEGNVVSLKPQVSGQIEAIKAKPNANVNKNDVLLQIAPTEYKIAVKKAEAKLKITGQQVGSQMANIIAAQAQLTTALIAQENAKRQGQRVLAMAEKGVVSKSDADTTRATIDKSNADVLNAQANLEKAKSQVGSEGKDNAQIQTALLELQQAQLDLSRTTMFAPANGAITNLNLSAGSYASAGSPLMTFVEKDSLWLEAYFRENSLGNIKSGDDVEIALDYAPGTTFKGTVSSIDLGVAWGQNDQLGKLANVQNQNGWLRDTQRIPVTIKLNEPAAIEMMRIGGQADVIIYTGDNALFNLLGKAWINLVSILSYVR